MIILESKLRIPSVSSMIMPRERLISYLEDHLDCTLFCITGNGGYGKTSLVSGFIRKKQLPTIWYNLTSQDRNIFSFLTYVKYAVSRQLGTNNDIEESNHETLDKDMNYILSVLSSHSSPLYIVFDDYQSIYNCKEVEDFISKMISIASSNITFFILSRIRPNIQFVQLKLQRKLAEIETSNLAFTQEEIAHFFNRINNLSLDKNEIALLHRKTEGWPISIQLLLDSIKEMPMEERKEFWLKFNGTPDINEYLTSEVL